MTGSFNDDDLPGMVITDPGWVNWLVPTFENGAASVGDLRRVMAAGLDLDAVSSRMVRLSSMLGLVIVRLSFMIPAWGLANAEWPASMAPPRQYKSAEPKRSGQSLPEQGLQLPGFPPRFNPLPGVASQIGFVLRHWAWAVAYFTMA